MTKTGEIRVNATDYDGDIVVEMFDYYQGSEPCWAVPAWEEAGFGDLAGPFASISDAVEAVRSATQ